MSFVLERITDKPPMTANTGMRSEMARAMKRHVAEWRKWSKAEAEDRGWAPIPGPVSVTVGHLRKDRRLPDVGAAYFVAKAMLDGLVDAGVLPGDGPDIVRSLTFTAPEVTGWHGVRLTIHELELHTPAHGMKGLTR